MKVQSIFALSALSSTLAMAKYRLIDLNVNKDYYEYIQDLPSRNTNDDEIPNEGPINTCFNNYCTQTGEYCGEWVGATVRRLPVWGAEVAEKYIDFEWPTQEEFDQMSPEAKIQSLEFKSTSSKEVESWLGSVKVNLTNGESSPIFQNSNYDPTLWERQETIEFDQNVSIRSVDSTFLYEYIHALQFYDSNEELAQEYFASAIPDYEEYVYDPSSRYELAENEELIGVYGVKDYYENFITFGFKVKVKQEQPVYKCPAQFETMRPEQQMNQFLKNYFKDQARNKEQTDAIDNLFDSFFDVLVTKEEDNNN